MSTGKAIKKRLTPEQLSDLAERLKNTEARLPAVLSQSYRHVIAATDSAGKGDAARFY